MMSTHDVLSSLLLGFDVAKGFFALAVGGESQADHATPYAPPPGQRGTTAPTISGYAYDVCSCEWEDDEEATFLPLWVPGTMHLDMRLRTTTERFGVDALLRERVMRRADGQYQINPVFRPDTKVWRHYDEQGEIYQLSSAHGLLIPGRKARYYLHDLAGLRSGALHPRDTLCVTVGAYEALVLRCMGLRAVSVVLPHVWNPELMADFFLLLRAERISRLVFWPYRLGGEWFPITAQLNWLASAAELAPGRGVSLRVMDISPLIPASMPPDGALQTVVHQYVKEAGWRRRSDLPPAPFGILPARIRAILEQSVPYARWMEGLPATLRRPTHWSKLDYADMPGLLRTQEVGRRHLLRGRVCAAGPVYCDPRTVMWSCPKAAAGTPGCWACDAASGNPTPCKIQIPPAFLFGLGTGNAQNRQKQLRDMLKAACKCADDPVASLRDEQPWRTCQVQECLDIQDRRAETQMLFFEGDMPLYRGKEYDFEVTCVKSEQSGQLVLLATSAFPRLPAMEEYRPYGPELADFKRFTLKEPATCQGVKEVIDSQVGAWLALIGQTGAGADMPRLVRTAWLLYATPFAIPHVAGVRRGGGASVFVLGDTSRGKSFPLERMMKILCMGGLADARARSATGLLAGPDGDQLAPGELALADRQLLVIDEAHSLDQDIWQALRQPRRDGVYEYRKVLKGKFHTRTRLVFVANPVTHVKPRSDRHPLWNATPYLDGPDISRFDLFMLARAASETPVAAAAGSPGISAETLRALVAHNWSKTYGDPSCWQVSAAAGDLVQAVAKELRAAYGRDDFPLLNGLHVPAVVLSWSVAAANLAPLVVDDRVRVHEVHVQYARDLLVEAATELGLKQSPGQSSAAVSPVELAARDMDGLVQELCTDPRRQAVARAFTTAEKLTFEELAGRTHLKAETLRKKIVPWLIEQGLLESRQGASGGVFATEFLRRVLPRLEYFSGNRDGAAATSDA